MDAAIMDQEWGIPIGTDVYTRDGDHLGSVVEGDAWELVVERGFFFIHDYRIRLSDVDRFEDGKLFLSLSREQVEEERRIG